MCRRTTRRSLCDIPRQDNRYSKGDFCFGLSNGSDRDSTKELCHRAPGRDRARKRRVGGVTITFLIDASYSLEIAVDRSYLRCPRVLAIRYRRQSTDRPASYVIPRERAGNGLSFRLSINAAAFLRASGRVVFQNCSPIDFRADRSRQVPSRQLTGSRAEVILATALSIAMANLDKRN
jgi:hypothetical protein